VVVRAFPVEHAHLRCDGPLTDARPLSA